jgi:hypothetical protein
VLQQNKEKPELGNDTWRPGKGHLTPKFKVAKEITYDYVWYKLYPAPISVTCPKWYKEGHLCSRGSAFGLKPTELLRACLINLLLESFGAPSLCLSLPITFLGHSSGIQSSVFTSLSLAQSPQPAKRAATARHHWTC